jgi:DNA-binding NarL/FixJ family response regulator
MHSNDSDRGDNNPLTKREVQVLAGAALDLTFTEIGEAMGITRYAVKTHVEHIRTKLEVRLSGAVAISLIQEWLPSDFQKLHQLLTAGFLSPATGPLA